MSEKIALTGNDAVALALKQVNPDVAAVFPITPQTELMHTFSQYVADGVVKTNLVTVESEHSAMSASIGAAAAGARAITATSSAGLALMWETLYIAASLRLPIVMPLVNRALSAPINIHCDHSDAMGMRDSGWIILFSENSQEAYDNTIQAFKIGENKNVLLPVAVCLDGFILSHTVEVLSPITDNLVQNFIGEYSPHYSLLNTEKPITVGPLVLTDYYFEFKRQQIESMKNALNVIENVGIEYEKISGRKYSLFETFNAENADIIIIGMGSAMGTTRSVVRKWHAKGYKVGILKIRSFRPFPKEEIKELLSKVECVAVLDRAASFGVTGGPLYHDIRSSLYNLKNKPLIKSYLYGLGGRDFLPQHVNDMISELYQTLERGVIDNEEGYLGLK